MFYDLAKKGYDGILVNAFVMHRQRGSYQAFFCELEIVSGIVMEAEDRPLLCSLPVKVPEY